MKGIHSSTFVPNSSSELFDREDLVVLHMSTLARLLLSMKEIDRKVNQVEITLDQNEKRNVVQKQ